MYSYLSLLSNNDCHEQIYIDGCKDYEKNQGPWPKQREQKKFLKKSKQNINYLWEAFQMCFKPFLLIFDTLLF